MKEGRSDLLPLRPFVLKYLFMGISAFAHRFAGCIYVCGIDAFNELVHVDFFAVIVARGLGHIIFFTESVRKFVFDVFNDQVDENAPKQERDGDADHDQ